MKLVNIVKTREKLGVKKTCCVVRKADALMGNTTGGKRNIQPPNFPDMQLSVW
jgi:hypothetical protein